MVALGDWDKVGLEERAVGERQGLGRQDRHQHKRRKFGRKYSFSDVRSDRLARDLPSELSDPANFDMITPPKTKRDERVPKRWKTRMNMKERAISKTLERIEQEYSNRYHQIYMQIHNKWSNVNLEVQMNGSVSTTEQEITKYCEYKNMYRLG